MANQDPERAYNYFSIRAKGQISLKNHKKILDRFILFDGYRRTEVDFIDLAHETRADDTIQSVIAQVRGKHFYSNGDIRSFDSVLEQENNE